MRRARAPSFSAAMDPDSDDWIPLGKREEWGDVTPLPVDAGKVIAIKYTEQHRECLGYFRAILQSREKSRRALDLTQAMIALNSADYTAWTYRCAAAHRPGPLGPTRPLRNPGSPAPRSPTRIYSSRLHAGPARAAPCPVTRPPPPARHTPAPLPSTPRARRWECLQALGASLAEEQAFTAAVAQENVKNYQLWNHRRKCAQALGAGNAKAELAFAAAALEQVSGRGERAGVL